jgi:hypothetical protein
MPEDPNVGNEGTPPEPTPVGEPTLTQEAVNKMVGSARVEARQAFLKKHGFTSEDEFTAAVKKAKEIEEAQLSELEKAQKQLDEYKTAAESAKAEADALRTANLRASIAREKGLKEAAVKYVVGDDEDSIKASVDDLLTIAGKSEPDDDLGGGTNPPGAADMGKSPDEKMANLLMHQLTHRSIRGG